jgi:hypothetical protein
MPSGGRFWRFKYRFQGKENCLSFGAYPKVSLEMARQLREEAKRMLANGLDPSEERKMEKASGAGAARSTVSTSVRVSNDGVTEIWKGRIALRLTPDEARFVKEQLCKLIA